MARRAERGREAGFRLPCVAPPNDPVTGRPDASGRRRSARGRAARAALRRSVYAGEGVPLEFWTARRDAPAPADAALPRPALRSCCSPRTSADPAAAMLAAGRDGDPDAGAGRCRLLDAVAVMDRLRSPGGCPWDAEQDHESLRQYLVEETYELLEAIEDGDRAAMREELGDVLLQVLFHARVAPEDADDPFDIDDVAAELVAKLVGRHPHVFEGHDPAVRDATSQQHRWEELKQAEKQRESSVDGVALGQPAVALAAKLVQRTRRAPASRSTCCRRATTPARRCSRSPRWRSSPARTRRPSCARWPAGSPANVRAAEAKARAEGIGTPDRRGLAPLLAGLKCR